ncbi:hypothetical protein TUM17387_04180 [Shewanella carassii]|nr:hypothetical protein TUM17387_04180 [Shewanella carassii]
MGYSSGGMTIVGVTLLTQLWHPGFQQGLIHTAVGVMAVGAVFHHGSMLPQHGATLIGMTFIASGVDTALLECTLGQGSRAGCGNRYRSCDPT